MKISWAFLYSGRETSGRPSQSLSDASVHASAVIMRALGGRGQHAPAVAMRALAGRTAGRAHRSPAAAARRRQFCSTALRPAEPVPALRPADLVPPAPVPRYGAADGVVTLNVGGKMFVTLRSTAQRSPVIARAIERAESQASLRLGEAVFIDRDPEHFGTLLNHMRNCAEGVARRKRRTPAFFSEEALPLPKEVPELRALYVEASHFGLEKLARRLCSVSLFARITYRLHMVTDEADLARLPHSNEYTAAQAHWQTDTISSHQGRSDSPRIANLNTSFML